MSASPPLRLSVDGRPLDLTLPAGWRVIDTLVPGDEPALDDPRAALRQALAAPIGCQVVPPGAWAGQRVLIAVDDVSRSTPLHRTFDVVLEWLRQAGVRDEDRLLIPALGIHRDMTAEEVAAKVGPANLAGLRWENHRPRERDSRAPSSQRCPGRSANSPPWS